MQFVLRELRKLTIPKLLGVFFLILPFSHIFWRNTLIWYAQNRVFHTAILLIFGYSLFQVPIKQMKSNLPLALFLIWLTFITGQWWYNIIGSIKVYPVLVLFPYLSFLFGILLYYLIVNYFIEEHFVKLFNLFSFLLGLMSIYAILQYFNLDQFYKNIDTSIRKDTLVGVLGNQTHFALYLAMCFPILYFVKSKWTNIFIVIGWIAIILSHSASAFIIAVILTIIYNLYYKIRFKYERLFAGILSGIFLFTIFFKKINLIIFFNPMGRIEFWRELWKIFMEYPITGAGLGRLQGMLPQRIGTIFQGWGHAHNEFYQMMIETGLIGLVLIIGCIIHYFIVFSTLPKTELNICLITIFIGFLLAGLTSFPAHLPVPATLGIFSYAGIYLQREQK